MAVQSAHRLRRLLPMAALIVEGWEPRRSRGGLEVLIDLNLGGAAGEALWLTNFPSIHQPPRDAHNVSGECLRRTAHSGAYRARAEDFSSAVRGPPCPEADGRPRQRQRYGTSV